MKKINVINLMSCKIFETAIFIIFDWIGELSVEFLREKTEHEELNALAF